MQLDNISRIRKIFKFPKSFNESDILFNLQRIEDDYKISSKQRYKERFHICSSISLNGLFTDAHFLYIIKCQKSDQTFKLLEAFTFMYFEYLDKRVTLQQFKNFQIESKLHLEYYENPQTYEIRDIKLRKSNDVLNPSLTFYVTKEFEEAAKQVKSREYYALKFKVTLFWPNSNEKEFLNYYDKLEEIANFSHFKELINCNLDAKLYGKLTGELLWSKYKTYEKVELINLLKKNQYIQEQCKSIVTVFTAPEIAIKETKIQFLRSVYDYLLDLEEDFE